MATGPWKLDPDRSREKLKTATAALNWRKVAYKCQWQALNWNNLPLPVPKKKIRKREMKRKKQTNKQNPKNCDLIFFRQKSVAIQSSCCWIQQTLTFEVAAREPAWWEGSQTCTCKGLNPPDQTGSRSQTVASVKAQVNLLFSSPLTWHEGSKETSQCLVWLQGSMQLSVL